MLDALFSWLREVWNHFKPIYFVYTYEAGVVFRGGKFLKILEPNNWYGRIPFLDDIFTENIALDTMAIKEVNVTTLDGKTTTIGCEFDLIITDIYKAIVTTHDWRSNLVDICRGVISDHIEDNNWEELRKKTTKNAIEKKLQKRGEELGISISNFNFTDKMVGRTLTLFNN
jgi:regulator of protease activity HflC (stomatin/prohibitin superfamily)